MENINEQGKTISYLSIDKYPNLKMDANSVVSLPAIESDFEHFAKGDDKYEYVLKPDFSGEELLKDNSHDHCKKHAGKQYTESQIRSWNANGNGFITENQDFFTNFPQQGYNLDSVLYNCRHFLKKVRTVQFDLEEFNDQFDDDEMIVEGPVMIANKLILRKNALGNGLGYIVFDNKTIKYLFDQFKLSPKLTYGHSGIDLSKKVYVRKSWLEEKDGNLNWFMSYRIFDKSLWFDIKNKIIKGFSVEISY